HAMIRREGDDRRAPHRRALPTGDRDIAGRQLFQAPQAPERFRQPIEPAFRPRQAVLIERTNRRDGVLQRHPRSLGFKRIGRPVITTYTSSASFANCWFTWPARSRKRRASGSMGTTPPPSSFETTRTRAVVIRMAWISLATNPGTRESGTRRSRRLLNQSVTQSTTIES